MNRIVSGETAWNSTRGKEQWFIRRAAAWTGRTIASMRVYDAQRGLAVLRGLPGAKGADVGFFARGEMCAVAAYAGLLDGGVAEFILVDPPATQNAPGNRGGTGPSIEMLGCLRVTDLPQVVGLLFPARITLAGKVPKSYAWTRSLYATLGKVIRPYGRGSSSSAW